MTLDTTVEYLMGNETQLKKGEISLDSEWLLLIEEAIRSGISKDDFSYYLDFVKFRNSSIKSKK